MELKRKAHNFDGEWAERFSQIAERNWTGVEIGGKKRKLKLTFMNVNLEKNVHHKAIMTIIKFPVVDLVCWAKETAEKLINDEMTLDWMENQDIYKEFVENGGIKITAVWNFPSEGPTVDDIYPLAFLLKQEEKQNEVKEEVKEVKKTI